MARSDLEQHHKLILADSDRDLFLELISNPPEPNEALLKFFIKIWLKPLLQTWLILS